MEVLPYCSPCSIVFDNQKNALLHLAGAKHLQREHLMQARRDNQKVEINGEDLSKCHVCDISLTSVHVALDHFMGSKHERKMKAKAEKGDLEAKAMVGNAKATVGNAKATVGNAKTMMGNTKAMAGNAKAMVGNSADHESRNPALFCSYCNVQTNSSEQFEQHCLGGRHKKKTERCRVIHFVPENGGSTTGGSPSKRQWPYPNHNEVAAKRQKQHLQAQNTFSPGAVVPGQGDQQNGANFTNYQQPQNSYQYQNVTYPGCGGDNAMFYQPVESHDYQGGYQPRQPYFHNPGNPGITPASGPPPCFPPSVGHTQPQRTTTHQATGSSKFASSSQPKQEFYCSYCRTTLNSQLQMDSHSAGKKHQEKVKAAMNPDKENPQSVSAGKDNNPYKQAVPERQVEEPGFIGPVLFCSLCNVTVNSMDQMSKHCSGQKHRDKASNVLTEK